MAGFFGSLGMLRFCVEGVLEVLGYSEEQTTFSEYPACGRVFFLHIFKHKVCKILEIILP